MKISRAPELKKLVTFIPNKKEPIHNWYYFKEGFSKKLVEIFIDKFKLNKNSLVLDPFCGCGTTLLACKQKGIKSIGFDVSPFFVFVSKVKTTDYDLGSLEKAISQILKLKREKPKKLPREKFVRKAFPRYTLEDVIFYKNKILEIKDEKVKNFLLLALIDSAMSVSWVIKDGAVVKIQKRGRPPLKKFFKYKLKKMLKDLKNTKIKPVETRVEIGDARNLKLKNKVIDAVITSPPYLNKIEYTKIYGIEMYFLGFPETKLRSYIGAKVKDINVSELGLNQNLPPIAKAYFRDINLALKEMYRVCKEGANLAIVIGGGCFPDRVIKTDEITAGLAKKIGFKVRSILIARESWCTRARTIKVGKVRESVIILKK